MLMIPSTIIHIPLTIYSNMYRNYHPDPHAQIGHGSTIYFLTLNDISSFEYWSPRYSERNTHWRHNLPAFHMLAAELNISLPALN